MTWSKKPSPLFNSLRFFSLCSLISHTLHALGTVHAQSSRSTGKRSAERASARAPAPCATLENGPDRKNHTVRSDASQNVLFTDSRALSTTTPSVELLSPQELRHKWSPEAPALAAPSLGWTPHLAIRPPSRDLTITPMPALYPGSAPHSPRPCTMLACGATED